MSKSITVKIGDSIVKFHQKTHHTVRFSLLFYNFVYYHMRFSVYAAITR